MNGSQQQFENFVALFRDAEQFSRTCVGTEEYESKFVEVLNFIKSHPELRADIVKEFLTLLQNRSYGPYELIEFCMHELKWPEMLSKVVDINAAFEQEVAQKKLLGILSQHLFYLGDVIASFTNKWEKMDLFDYHYKKRT